MNIIEKFELNSIKNYISDMFMLGNGLSKEQIEKIIKRIDNLLKQ